MKRVLVRAEKYCRFRHIGIISGSNTMNLSREVEISTFADGEKNIEILERCHRKSMYLIHSLSKPVNDNLIEFLLLLDAIKREAPSEITCIIPYLCYARQDRLVKIGQTISSQLVGSLISTLSPTKVVVIDIHSQQAMGFFGRNINDVINLEAKDLLVESFFKTVTGLENVTIVSPDAGGVKRANGFKHSLGILAPNVRLHSAMAIKKRDSANQVATMDLVGSVAGTDSIIVDDMIDTAGTLVKCAEMLYEAGSKRVFACATHGLFNGDSLELIEKSCLEKVFVTNSIDQPFDKSSKIVTTSLSRMISQFISHNEEN